MAESLSDNEAENTVTMCDVLQEEQELEEDANAVLGGSDDTNCSYDRGYISRQALYACKTCNVNGEAGVCLACCYACHDGHEVVELYTKRNFRCDCGNSKFNKPCTLRPNKEPVNSKNKYNHNFKGLYCVCRRPYPDLEDTVADQMIQCVMCEDWYHGRHLGSKVPDDYFEMICQACMETHKFLYSYLNGDHVTVDEEDGKQNLISEPLENGTAPTSTGGKIPKEVKNESSSDPSMVSKSVIKEEYTFPESNSQSNTIISSFKNEQVESKDSTLQKVAESCSQSNSGILHIENKPNSKVSTNNEEDSGNTKQAITPVKIEIIDEASKVDNNVKSVSNENCTLKKLHSGDRVVNGSAFWPENWRMQLCRCSSCMDLYTSTKCEFLLNPDDTIEAYEVQGRGRTGESQYDKGLSALGQLDRVKQMEAVRAYTNMKGQLLEYLKEFADNKRTVCESDIKEFFERMGKKQKLNNGVPHFCR